MSNTDVQGNVVDGMEELNDVPVSFRAKVLAILATVGALAAGYVTLREVNYRAHGDAMKAIGICLDENPIYEDSVNGTSDLTMEQISSVLSCANGKMDEQISDGKLWDGAPRPTEHFLNVVLNERKDDVAAGNNDK